MIYSNLSDFRFMFIVKSCIIEDSSFIFFNRQLLTDIRLVPGSRVLDLAGDN